jgi:glycosyltransferase involved in cell wall biosynthesis
MRVALVSTPFVSVPPRAYGGTELVVYELAVALRAKGHEVVVYATGDSAVPGVEVRSYYPWAHWPPEAAIGEMHAAFCMRDIIRDPRGFDIVHLHTPPAVPFAHQLDCPVVYTLHHDVDASLSARYLAAPDVALVAISRAQGRRELANVSAVVHHGLDPARFRAQEDQGYLLFLGRYDRCKGADLALDVAARAHLPLILAGAPHEERYYEDEIKPRLARGNVMDVGPVGGRPKIALIARARAVLFPIRWDEPFGLVMIEAMLSGVPVIALSRGSVPEVVDQGVTGIACDDTAELVLAARTIHKVVDRARVRTLAQQRWSASRMAQDYLSLYLALGAVRPSRGSEAQGAVDNTAANS